MSGKLKSRAKKYIAGGLTVALIAGLYQGYGLISTQAQEKTLPGIEKIVAQYLESGETFRILEVVPEENEASIGYLLGGEEPVAQGRKLSEMPSAVERVAQMEALEQRLAEGELANIVSKEGPVSFSAYEEAEKGSREEIIRGEFVAREDGLGDYNYLYKDAVYRMLSDGETAEGERYDRLFTFAEDEVQERGVSIAFSKFREGSLYLETTLTTEAGAAIGHATERYALTADLKMSDVSLETFAPDEYVNKSVYVFRDEMYTYYGRMMYGAQLPEDYEIITEESGVTPDVSGGDGAVTTAGVSAGDAVAMSVMPAEMSLAASVAEMEAEAAVGESTDISKNLYVVNYIDKTAYTWATYDGEDYSLTHLADGHFAELAVNKNGDYYISAATVCEEAPWKLTESYRVNDTGRYVLVSKGETLVTYRGEEGFDETQTYDFVGDYSRAAVGIVQYDGGFDNQEWFKKYVLNLSDDELERMQIEVTTLTMEELAALATDGAYCGISLEEVDFIYLSGKGTYGAEPAGMNVAALQLIRLAYGVQADNSVDNMARVPVVMDYGFLTGNSTAGNSVAEKMALLLLLSEDETWVKQLAVAGADVWDSLSVSELREQVKQKLNNALADSGLSDISLEGLKEYVAANVYLHNDTVTPYVSSDYLTDFSDAAMSGAHKSEVFAKVLAEIEYENFLLSAEAARTAEEAELISTAVNKAAVTRYIMNWSMRRTTVKTALNVLELEPCYDFSLTIDTVKDYMNMPEYAGNIDITYMPSEEFIGKIEDLNERYDLIYVGDNTGTMNVDKYGYTAYNDAAMNGLVYTHVGDYYSYSKEGDTDKLRLKDDSLYDDKNNIGEVNYYRGPGNDMNSTREEEFEQYIEAGYPVVFAEELLKNINGEVAVNENRVDVNSYFYKLIAFALSKDETGNYKYWQKNVYADSQLTQYGGTGEAASVIEARQAAFCNYLNLSKLNINWVTDLGEVWKPVEYDGDVEEEERYLKPMGGVYQMQFIFSLSNDAAVSQISTNYDCKLFIDNNADGRFAGADYTNKGSSAASEELSGVTIYVLDGSVWTEVKQQETAEGMRYALYTGRTYKLVRKLPDDYQGMLPWKLVFYDNADRLVRTSMSGYTAVNRGSREKIRVLQLMSDKDPSGNKKNWNLASDDDVSELLEDIQEFEVEVTSIRVTDFLDDMGIADYEVWNGLNNGWSEPFFQKYYNAVYSEINTYDMLILGFADNYAFGEKPSGDSYSQSYLARTMANQAAAEAIRDYIEAGRSVLFTHDSSSYINTKDTASNSWYWGYDFNKVLRASVGLDRYGALKEYYADKVNSADTEAERNRYQEYLSILEDEEQYQYDTMYQPGEKGKELVHKEGLTKYTVVRYMTNHFSKLFSNKGSAISSSGYSAYFPVNNKLFYNALYKTGTAKDALIGNYANYKTDSDAPGPSLTATMVNEGQITNYPFKVSDDELKTLTVANTHYQWLQPNMELDRDLDGKNDIVVWYCLSDLSEGAKANKKKDDGSTNNVYNICPNDVVNNYYIYSMGNVTYSGAGHTTPDNLAEKKLFVNTMVAAYSAGVKAPGVSFENESGDVLESVYMMYDPVNHFVLNGQDHITVNFSAVDYNILSGGMEIRVEFFKQCEDSAEGAVSVDGIDGKVLPIATDKMVVSNTDGVVTAQTVTSESDCGDYFIEGTGYYSVQGGKTYTLQLDTSALGLLYEAGDIAMIRDAAADTIYVRATTVYDSGSEHTESGVHKLTVSAAELFELK